jgi:hypothetical protein
MQGWTSNVLKEAPKEVTHKVTIGATQHQFEDQHLAAGCHDQLETWTQILGESLQVCYFHWTADPPYLSCTTWKPRS